MDEQDIESGLKAFVADLEVGGQRVPIDRVIRTHLALFEGLRAMHLTWPAIATLVVRAGGRRRDGGPISADQIRADVGRLLQRRNERSSHPDEMLAAQPPPQRDRSLQRGAEYKAQRVGRPPNPAALKKERASPRPNVPTQQRPIGDALIDDVRGTKDVTDADISAALKKIQKH